MVANARTERIVLWNRAAENIFGYSTDEALQLPLHCLVPDNLRETHRTGIARFQQTGTGNLIDGGNPVELVAVHKDGHEIPVELTLTKVPDPTAEGDRFALAIIRDVSVRKEAEVVNRKLQQSTIDRRHALQLNDMIVQGLAVAKLALETGHTEKALAAVTKTLTEAKSIVSELLTTIENVEGELGPGRLTRPARED